MVKLLIQNLVFVTQKLDDFILYLSKTEKENKSNSISFKIRKIINLINQIKQAFFVLNNELKSLERDLNFVRDQNNSSKTNKKEVKDGNKVFRRY